MKLIFSFFQYVFTKYIGDYDIELQDMLINEENIEILIDIIKVYLLEHYKHNSYLCDYTGILIREITREIEEIVKKSPINIYHLFFYYFHTQTSKGQKKMIQILYNLKNDIDNKINKNSIVTISNETSESEGSEETEGSEENEENEDSEKYNKKIQKLVDFIENSILFYNKTKHLQRYITYFQRKYLYKYSKRYIKNNSCDLLLNELDNVNDKYKLYIIQKSSNTNIIYTFTIDDIISLYKSSFMFTNDMISLPKHISNPYNRNSITKTQEYMMFTALNIIKTKIPDLLYVYGYKSNFSVDEFKVNYHNELFENAVTSYIKDELDNALPYDFYITDCIRDVLNIARTNFVPFLLTYTMDYPAFIEKFKNKNHLVEILSLNILMIQYRLDNNYIRSNYYEIKLLDKIKKYFKLYKLNYIEVTENMNVSNNIITYPLYTQQTQEREQTHEINTLYSSSSLGHSIL
jgi:hypothetical protein